jgi:ABC-type multidrug transport system fused ATPase/permease subunit
MFESASAGSWRSRLSKGAREFRSFLIHGGPSWMPTRGQARSLANNLQGANVIILGIILLIIGFLAKIAIVWTVGIIVLIVGAILALLGMAGHAVGGRRHYF